MCFLRIITGGGVRSSFLEDLHFMSSSTPYFTSTHRYEFVGSNSKKLLELQARLRKACILKLIYRIYSRIGRNPLAINEVFGYVV